MIRYGDDEGPGSMMAILSQKSELACACERASVSNGAEKGFQGWWEWMRNVRKPKKGKE